MRLAYVFLCCLTFFVSCSNENMEDEPLYQEQWSIHYDKAFYEAYDIDKDAHIHAEKSLLSYTGKGVKIAVIDMGIDRKHPEYRDNLTKIINSRDGSDKIICDDIDVCYHGTAVMGVIASNINGIGLRGIAPEAEMIFIHLDLKGYVGDDEILDALYLAEKENVDIINASWGTGEVSPIVKEKIDDMASNGRKGKGIIFVFASGNKGQNSNNDESMLESVIGVGSTDEENLRAIYSNFGQGLDIMVGGGFNLGITTTYPQNVDTHLNIYLKAEAYKKFQGTSASAPIVSGSIALLLESSPLLSRIEVQNILKDTADKIGNVEYINSRNNYYGYGKLNLDKAITQIDINF